MSLTRREKQLALCGIICLGVLLAFQVFVRPALARTKTLKRVVSEKREILADLQAKSREYKSLRQKLEKIHMAMKNQQKDKKMLSSIERIQKDCGLTQNVVNMTPSTASINDAYEKTSVEVKYGAVKLDQIIQLLLKIDSSDLLIGIKSLEIKHTPQNPAFLDASIQLVGISNTTAK
jgi:Tfp pilus assembly protein PilO